LALEEQLAAALAAGRQLEQRLAGGATREAALEAEAQALREKYTEVEAVNARLRLDLQEVTMQAARSGDRPYYMGCSDFRPTDVSGARTQRQKISRLPLEPISSAQAWVPPHGAGLTRAGLDSLGTIAAGGAREKWANAGGVPGGSSHCAHSAVLSTDRPWSSPAAQVVHAGASNSQRSHLGSPSLSGAVAGKAAERASPAGTTMAGAVGERLARRSWMDESLSPPSAAAA